MSYHEHSAISRSGLKCFRDEGRRVYHARHVLRLPEAQKKPTDAMKLGSLCHAELLEPGTLEGQFAIRPDEWQDWRTKAAKQWRDEQEAAGKIVVTREDIADKLAIVQAAVAVAGDFVTHGAAIVEQPIHWVDADSGLECRCKPDWLIPRKDRVLAFDFKCTDSASPSAFAANVASQGLWLQDEHYSRGITMEYRLPVDFFFVAVESKYPYRASMHRVQFAPEMRDEYSRTMEALEGCYRRNDWSEPWEAAIHAVEVRDWKLRSDSVPQEARV